MDEQNWRVDPQSRVDAAFAACSLTLGLFSVGTLIAVGYLNYTRLPWFDAWEHWIRYLGSSDSLTFFFSQHNEHRIPVSRLLYLIDQRWFSADTRFLLWSTFLAQFGSALLVYRLACSSGDLPFVYRVHILGLILALAFAASQWINFTWTFQVCFVVVFFAAIAAFAALKNSVQRGRSVERSMSAPWFITSIVMALIATGSMANGLLVWPLLVLMAICLGLPRKMVGSLVIVGAAVSFAYLHGYQPRAGIRISESLMKTPEIVTYSLAYLGSAVDEPVLAASKALGLDWEAYRVPLSALAGLIGIGWFFRFVIASIRGGSGNGPGRIAMLHILAFLAASAVLTAVGRVQFPIKDALTSRYVTPSLLFWACLIGLAVSESATGARSERRASSYRLRVASLLAVAFVVLMVQLPKVAYAADSERFLSEGEYALINNVFAPEGWQRFVGSGAPGRMIPVVRYFRARHLASFSRDWTYWIGDPVRAHFVLDSTDSECKGEWESVTSVGGSFSPAALGGGWAYDRRYNRAPDRIVFADDGMRVVGFATSTRRRPDLIVRYPELTTERLGWAAYLPAGVSSEMTAFVLLGDGRSLCRVGRALVPGHYVTAPAAKAGGALAGVEASARGTWGRDLRPPGTAAPPFVTETWSSLTLDSPGGELRFGPVKVTAGSSIGLPLLTGPAASTVRVSVIERGTGEVLATARPPAGASAWDLWRLDMPSGAPAMLVDYVVDQSEIGAGNWVLVGLPRSINP